MGEKKKIIQSQNDMSVSKLSNQVGFQVVSVIKDMLWKVLQKVISLYSILAQDILSKHCSYLCIQLFVFVKVICIVKEKIMPTPMEKQQSRCIWYCSTLEMHLEAERAELEKGACERRVHVSSRRLWSVMWTLLCRCNVIFLASDQQQ